MRIQILSQYYAPERSGNAPYVTGMAEFLSGDHDVTVITGVAHYPEWRVHPEFKAWRADASENGPRVIRLRHYVPRRPSALRRIPYELTWVARALAESRKHPADVVIGAIPGLFTSHLVSAAGRLHHAPTGIIVQDIISRAATQTGIKGGQSLSGAIFRAERWGLRHADGVCTIHQRFADVLATEYGLEPATIRVIHNWSHIDAPSTAPRADIRRQMGWSSDEIVVLHSGNMGLKQGLSNVIDAARLADNWAAPVRFVLAGDGNQRAALELAAYGVKHLDIIDSVAKEIFPDFLHAADVLLINEQPGVLEMSLPSKLTSYLAAARPVLAATEQRSATAELVEATGAGLVVAAGDPAGLLDGALDLGSNPDRAEKLGLVGRKFAMDNMNASVALTEYQRWVESLVC
ncbi:MAG: glycosyltransferase WbuB [Jatrophihabitantaceae bacterium]|nr:glycosyltransferase WbuB [Jatrophihabitantaceae bacterium]